MSKGNTYKRPTFPITLGSLQKEDPLYLLAQLQDYLVYHAPPGPPIFTVRHTVNLSKGTMMLYLFALMCYFDNFSLGAWAYLALHGSYGLLWVAKDMAFPDPLTQRKQTFVSWLILVVPVLIPY